MLSDSLGALGASATIVPSSPVRSQCTKPVNSPSDAAREIRSAMNGKDHAVALRVLRNGQSVFVGIAPDQTQNAG